MTDKEKIRIENYTILYQLSRTLDIMLIDDVLTEEMKDKLDDIVSELIGKYNSLKR